MDVNQEGEFISVGGAGPKRRTVSNKATNPLEVEGAEGGHAHPLDGGAEPAYIVRGGVV